MAIFLQESFTNTSGLTVNLNTLTPTVGEAWVQSDGLFNSGAGSVFVYVEGHARTNTSTTLRSAYNLALPAIASVRVSANIGSVTNTTTAQPGLMFCADVASDSCYYARWNLQSCKLYRVSAGVAALVADTGNNAALYGAQVPGPTPVEIVYSDGLISIYRYGSLILSYQDPVPLGIGHVGVLTTGGGYVDDLVAEEAGSSATPTIANGSGVATVSGAGGSTRQTTGASVGVASSSAISNKFQTGFGNSISAASVAGVGQGFTLLSASAVAAGSTSSNFQGGALRILTAVGSAAGSAVGQASSDLTEVGVGQSSGQAVTLAQAVAIKAAVAASVAGAVFVGVSREFGLSDGFSASSSEAGFTGGSISSAVGSSNGVADVFGTNFPGSRFIIVAGSQASGAGRSTKAAAGSSSGQASAGVVSTGIYDLTAQSVSQPVVDGVGHQIIEVVGQITASSDSYFLSFGIQLFPVDDDRVVELTAEDREVTLAGEDRVVTLAGEDRVVELASYDLTSTLDRADRTVELAAEDRTVTLASEDRMITL